MLPRTPRFPSADSWDSLVLPAQRCPRLHQSWQPYPLLHQHPHPSLHPHPHPHPSLHPPPRPLMPPATPTSPRSCDDSPRRTASISAALRAPESVAAFASPTSKRSSPSALPHRPRHRHLPHPRHRAHPLLLPRPTFVGAPRTSHAYARSSPSAWWSHCTCQLSSRPLSKLTSLASPSFEIE